MRGVRSIIWRILIGRYVCFLGLLRLGDVGVRDGVYVCMGWEGKEDEMLDGLGVEVEADDVC
jgi:hypothetical protein